MSQLRAPLIVEKIPLVTHTWVHIQRYDCLAAGANFAWKELQMQTVIMIAKVRLWMDRFEKVFSSWKMSPRTGPETHVFRTIKIVADTFKWTQKHMSDCDWTGTTLSPTVGWLRGWPGPAEGPIKSARKHSEHDGISQRVAVSSGLLRVFQSVS